MSSIGNLFRLAVADPETREVAKGIDRFASACRDLGREVGDDPRVARQALRLSDASRTLIASLTTLTDRLRQPFTLVLPDPRTGESAAAYLERVRRLRPSAARDTITWK